LSVVQVWKIPKTMKKPQPKMQIKQYWRTK